MVVRKGIKEFCWLIGKDRHLGSS